MSFKNFIKVKLVYDAISRSPLKEPVIKRLGKISNKIEEAGQKREEKKLRETAEHIESLEGPYRIIRCAAEVKMTGFIDTSSFYYKRKYEILNEHQELLYRLELKPQKGKIWPIGQEVCEHSKHFGRKTEWRVIKGKQLIGKYELIKDGIKTIIKSDYNGWTIEIRDFIKMSAMIINKDGDELGKLKQIGSDYILSINNTDMEVPIITACLVILVSFQASYDNYYSSG